MTGNAGHKSRPSGRNSFERVQQRGDGQCGQVPGQQVHVVVVLGELGRRYRIYPAPGQQRALARAFGCARVVYNDCLRLRDACHLAGEQISDTEIQRRVVTLAKLTPERAWLAEVASVALVQACQDARRAYRNWFDSLLGQRKGGDVIPNPRFLRSKERRLAHAQRALSRSQKGSANREKARRRVAVLHRKVRDCRLDHAHKTALRVVRDNQAVYSEDLCVSGLARDVNAARNILAAGRADKSNACGGQVRPAPMLAPASEAGTLRGAA
jgi:transposase